jgi:DNA-binding XRE family transcriptional regulator
MTKDRVVISRAAWKQIAEVLEDADDRLAVRASRARGRRGHDDALPVAFYRRIRLGEHPVRVWRDYRGFGLNELAERAKVARGYLSEIENGKKAGSTAALKRIADALNIALDDAVPATTRRKTSG